ncbi:MAG: oligosaccharide flippase family protein [Deltaproteobacteria bacterium]|nr:oligosaccharide flippase family protein [Deltaproteobacteria bacterium]
MVGHIPAETIKSPPEKFNTSETDFRRLKRAGLGGITGVLGKGTAIAVSFISVPLTVSYLGPERYGVWITISSFVGWLSVSDVGFGSALNNALAEAHGLRDDHLAQGLVSTAFWTMCAVAIFIGILALILVPELNWTGILNFEIPTEYAHGNEVRISIGLAFLFFCLSFPPSLVSPIYNAYQEVHKGNLWAIAGNLISFAALLLVVQIRGGLPLLVIALMGSTTGVKIVNMIHLCCVERPYLRPILGCFRRSHFRRLWNLGIFYLVQQIGNIGMFQVQPIILTQMKGPMVVGPFSVAYKLLSLPQQMLILFLTPLIGAYGEARVRDDWLWIRRVLLQTIAVSVGLMILTVIPLAILAPWIIPLWAGESMLSDPLTIFWLSLYAVGTSLATPVAMFLQGLERARDIATVTIFNGTATIVSSLLLIPTFGVKGMAIAMFISLIIFNCIWQVILAAKIVIKFPTDLKKSRNSKNHK